MEAPPLHAVVVAGGPWDLTDLVIEALRSADLLIAADQGVEALLRLGYCPGLVIGDMDSITPATLERLRARGVAVDVHPERKDMTDTHLALLAAVERGASDIALIGALGGERPDHGIANVLLLRNDTFAQVRLRLIEGRGEAHVVRGSLELHGAPGDYVSLLPLTERVTGITTHGLEYALHDATLLLGESRGVSNEIIASRAGVQIGSGVLLVTHQHTTET